MPVSKIYYDPETAITFKSSGGSAVLTPTSVISGNGRLSAQFDRGAGALAAQMRWQARFKLASAGTVGAPIRIYLVTGQDGTWIDGNFSTSDQTVTSEDLFRNAILVGQVIVDQATTGPFVKSGMLWVYSRYIQMAFFNSTAVNMSATATDGEIDLTPMPDEAQ